MPSRTIWPIDSPTPEITLPFQRFHASPSSSSACADSVLIFSVESFSPSTSALSVGSSSAPLLPNSSIAMRVCSAGSLIDWMPLAMAKNCSSGESARNCPMDSPISPSALTVSLLPSESRFWNWLTADATWSSELPEGSATACNRCKPSIAMPVRSESFVRLSAASSAPLASATTVPPTPAADSAPAPIPVSPSRLESPPPLPAPAPALRSFRCFSTAAETFCSSFGASCPSAR